MKLKNPPASVKECRFSSCVVFYERYLPQRFRIIHWYVSDFFSVFYTLFFCTYFLRTFDELAFSSLNADIFPEIYSEFCNEDGPEFGNSKDGSLVKVVLEGWIVHFLHYEVSYQIMWRIWVFMQKSKICKIESCVTHYDSDLICNENKCY
ncbi:unnamed protein product [Moneuplotes crassus]|uniref:Uncharacterized protein n=1 Tax=Euplotes crassus TaxID=5936 RepID=A0AAD1U894_EUPCR|nr:unnamed protein product [Moneuplotes crassus]